MSSRILVGTRKGLFLYDRNQAGEWGVTRTAFLGDPVSMVLSDPRSGFLYAALRLGHFGAKIHRSADDGVTWEELPAPVFPEKPPEEQTEGQEVKSSWKLDQFWALETGGADQPGRLWAGTIPGGLFQSDDDGKSWQLVESLWNRPEREKWFGGGADEPGIHSVCVDPRNSRRVVIGVSCGGAWTTLDDGESWTCTSEGMRAAFMPPERQFDPIIQDPHRIVQCPSAPDSYWTQHHNGIFRSVNGAASWEEIDEPKPSGFGFAVAVHPEDPETAWFVPAVKDECRIPVDGHFVVTRTRDGGKSFETLRQGLPQQPAYDLVYRHAMDIDRSGNRLTMGSTTGSLWVSDDQGDSWNTLSHHLPPVYCVRFGPA